MIEKLIKYILVGIVNSAFAYGVYAGLIFLGVHYRLAVLLTFVIGILFNFKTIGRIVFKSNDNRLIIRFAASYMLVYLVANAGLEISHRTGFSLYAAGVLMMPLGAALSFVLFNYFVFRETK